MASDSSGPNGDLRANTVKRRRTTQACDYCHQRSIRCRVSDDGVNCQNCRDFAQPCTYHRQPRRRGVKPRAGDESVVETQGSPVPRGRASDTGRPSQSSPRRPSAQGSLGHAQSAQVAVEQPHSTPTTKTTTFVQRLDPRKQLWVAPVIASQATIVDLVELYFEIVYPVFPLFHQPSFVRSISRAEYTTNKGLFATTMALCALVSSRVRDGSVTNPKWDLRSLQVVQPDSYYDAARDALIGETSSELNIIRSHALMSITAIQNGRIRDMHYHLGTYHTLVAMDALHDESNWPRNISVIEREERRRLFWSIYTLDVYTSVVWGGIMRSREQQSNVAYPVELDDEFIDDSNPALSNNAETGLSPSLGRHSSSVQSNCWLSGWNFITDLYRILEHALARFRGHRSQAPQSSFLYEIFGNDENAVTETSVRDRVLEMYLNLPDSFKETPQMTYNIKMDRFGFQAANITGSLQLVRMVLFAAGGTSIQERCQIASEVVSAFASIPVAYLLAISTPQLHHLGGIGAILGSVFEERLSEAEYNDVRSVMLSMAGLMENLEANQPGSSASGKLRSHVARIDEYMARQRFLAGIDHQEPIPSNQNNSHAPDQQAVLTDGAPPVPEPYEPYSQGGVPQPALPMSFQIPPDLLGEFTWNFDFG